MGVLLIERLTVTATLMRSPNRPPCAECGKRRVGYRIVLAAVGQMANLPPYRCAADIGITQPSVTDADVRALAERLVDAEPSLWEGPDQPEARTSVALDKGDMQTLSALDVVECAHEDSMGGVCGASRAYHEAYPDRFDHEHTFDV